MLMYVLALFPGLLLDLTCGKAATAIQFGKVRHMYGSHAWAPVLSFGGVRATSLTPA